MSKSQNLGIITSYGYAVAGGYIGTVEDYERYLASLPSYTNQAQASANEAAASAATAEAAAEDVVEQANRAEAAATVASGSATDAATAAATAEGVVTTVETYKTQAQGYAGDASTAATAAARDANTAHDNAQSAIQSAQQATVSATTAESYTNTASTYAASAQTSATNARASKEAAATSETNATAKAVLSESWAVGGTGTRQGENTNNAKYWAQQAQAVVGLGDFTGATASSSGSRGLVPAPSMGQEHAFLRGDGTWSDSTAGSASSVEYSNETSELKATNVQDAIDEVYQYATNVQGNVDELGQFVNAVADNAFSTNNNVSDEIEDDDYVPFLDTSEGGPRLILKSNFSATITIDSELSTTSTNAVENRVITNALSAKADSSSLATVATSGNYSDLTGKPTLAAVATSGAYSDLSGTPTLSTVATSGSYNDLSNTPILGTAAAKNFVTTVGTTQDLITSAAVNTELDKKADKPTFKSQTLAAGSTSVTFTGIPTTGDYIVDIFTSTGIGYNELVPSGSSLTVNFDEQSDSVTVFCKIEKMYL